MICNKAFFGGSIPTLNISKMEMEKLARDSINQGLTVPGVQKKISLHLKKSKTDSRLTMVGYPSGYILKPQSEEYRSLPECEDFAMTLAGEFNISVAPFGLVNIEPQNEWGYITKRIDRGIENRKNIMFAMEDFCQLSERNPEEKYKSSYEQCAKIIDKYSTRNVLDKVDLFVRIIYSFIIGNSDMHLKNLSLIEDKPGSRQFILSRAYDLLTVNLVNEEDNEELALTLCGKKSNFKRADFIAYGENIGIDKKAVEKLLNKAINLEDKCIAICNNSFMPGDLKERECNIIKERINRLKTN